jgi:S1-C subfamily serine protease
MYKYLFFLCLIACRPASADPTPPTNASSSTESVAHSTTVSLPALEFDPKASSELTVAFLLNDYSTFCAGVWIDSQHILTAYHCMQDSYSYQKNVGNVNTGFQIKYRVPTWDGKYIKSTSKIYTGTVVKLDAAQDLALVKTSLNSKFATMGEVNLTDEVHVVGHLHHLNWTYANGVVSAFRADISGHPGSWMQLASYIDAGMSGGGVFNSKGQLVGIISFRHQPSTSAFAVPIEVIEKFIKK